MKKNYIAYLKEYEAKSSSFCKQDKYRKKFIKSVYCHDKENLNPNVPASSHKKPKEHASSSKKHNKSHLKPKQPTEPKEQLHLPEPVKQPRPRTTIKTPSSKQIPRQESYISKQYAKLVKLLQRKQLQEHQNCLNYYNWVRQLIASQEELAQNYIAQVFQSAKVQVQQACSSLQLSRCRQLPQFELQLVSVVFDPQHTHLLQEMIAQISIFSIGSLGDIQELSTGTKLAKPESDYSRSWEKQWFQGDSFATKGQDLGFGETGNCLEGISPTFKQF